MIVDVDDLILWLTEYRDRNVELADNTPDYVSYQAIYLGKSYAYDHVLEHLESLKKERTSYKYLRLSRLTR